MTLHRIDCMLKLPLSLNFRENAVNLDLIHFIHDNISHCDIKQFWFASNCFGQNDRYYWLVAPKSEKNIRNGYEKQVYQLFLITLN